MADRPYVDFAEVKQCISLPEVLEVFGIAGQFTRTGNKLHGVCPLPSHAHGPSPNPDQFKIDFKDGVWLWHCFGDCQQGGDVIEFCKAMKGFSDAHVRLFFAQHFGERLKLKKPKRIVVKPAKNAAAPTTPQGAEARAASNSTAIVTGASPALKPLRFFLNLDPNVLYLQQRGLQPETIKRFKLGLCSKGVLDGYVAMPVYAPNTNDLVAYFGRWPGEDYDEKAGRPRYKWPKDFPKSHAIFGLRQALEEPATKPLIVVEGPFGVFHLCQNGRPNAVAIFGSSLSEEQAAILAGTNRSIVLLFDGDEAGQAGMRTAAGKLITRAFVRVAKLPSGLQPDGLSAEQVAALLSFLS